MAVNANIALHGKLNHGPTLMVNCFNRSSVSSDVLTELESARLLLTGHHPAGSALAASDHHNPAFGNEVALAILFEIVSNFGSRGITFDLSIIARRILQPRPISAQSMITEPSIWL